jgi:hypothetical protein
VSAERCPRCGMFKATRFGGFGCGASWGEPYSYACDVRQRDITIARLEAENAALKAVVEAARPIVKFTGDNFGETVADELDNWDLALAALARVSR